MFRFRNDILERFATSIVTHVVEEMNLGEILGNARVLSFGEQDGDLVHGVFAQAVVAELQALKRITHGCPTQDGFASDDALCSHCIVAEVDFFETAFCEGIGNGLEDFQRRGFHLAGNDIGYYGDFDSRCNGRLEIIRRGKKAGDDCCGIWCVRLSFENNLVTQDSIARRDFYLQLLFPGGHQGGCLFPIDNFASLGVGCDEGDRHFDCFDSL
mmetsp:Transcript_1062/g.2449  ORF Transcript_1062/g.2449 Transcript_1062/m.2449 type:complete len:213 (-) Transcript_1062:52-690(-)